MDSIQEWISRAAKDAAAGSWSHENTALHKQTQEKTDRRKNGESLCRLLSRCVLSWCSSRDRRPKSSPALYHKLIACLKKRHFDFLSDSCLSHVYTRWLAAVPCSHFVFSFQGFYGTVALVANLSLSLIDSCVMWWISFTQSVSMATWDLHFQNSLSI